MGWLVHADELPTQCFLKTSTEISRDFSENERNPNYKRQHIALIKRLKAGLENLLISPSPKRRIGEWAMRDDRRSEYPTPPCSLNVAPTKSDYE